MQSVSTWACVLPSANLIQYLHSAGSKLRTVRSPSWADKQQHHPDWHRLPNGFFCLMSFQRFSVSSRSLVNCGMPAEVGAATPTWRLGSAWSKWEWMTAEAQPSEGGSWTSWKQLKMSQSASFAVTNSNTASTKVASVLWSCPINGLWIEVLEVAAHVLLPPSRPSTSNEEHVSMHA